ncbi:conserved hypothetical protein [Histoplasma capsulatum G186AR]|uniref:Uncharacterized protein n=1 Tax=Ajellomyces capsulatus (strain G186AR / H82 / ATCC MYA-2454 / RMSCC 2432) TaxID=447093 RepID=C0NVI4_AJECG|nr:uncharacterized protein HCBG_07164 [Histoplasma capsulatum G186AR]EEH04523.1 conserved hypothetical protein [Histoplasma capsulatum G186AR]
MVDILDDKSQLCIHFLLEQLGIHEQKYSADLSPPPFFVGLNGVQGAGKTVLVSGQGDRLPESEWEVVNDVSAGQERVKVVIFEGWCVGFRALPEAELRRVWEDAVQLCVRDPVGYKGRLGYVKFEDVKMINDALRAYDAFTDDAEDTHLVYDWRQEQERTLLSTKGAGMTVEQVNKFVDGYYPSYELFVPNLRKGVFAAKQEPAQRPGSTTDDSSWEGKQLRLIVNRQRKYMVQEMDATTHRPEAQRGTGEKKEGKKEKKKENEWSNMQKNKDERNKNECNQIRKEKFRFSSNPDSNKGHCDLQSHALTAELLEQFLVENVGEFGGIM